MALSVSKKSRKSINTKLSEYLGGPKKFLQTEFPTLRDCLQRCLDLQRNRILVCEKNPRNINARNFF